jgi:phospho-N-acetylmuramoyl-pentapeptide-transferase
VAAGFVAGLALYPPLIGALRGQRAGQVVQQELPESHQVKAGTPTGGGILFTALGIVGGLLAVGAGHPGALPAAVALAVGGGLGFLDDLSKLRRGPTGVPARLKFPLQVVLAVPVAWLAHAPNGGHQLLIPVDLGWLYWPLAVLAIVGTANAVNLTDGIDGLAGGLALIAVGGVVVLLPGSSAGERTVGLVLVGALAAFLVYNRHPARVFMGDTGALALGYALAAMAIQQHGLLLLLILGAAFAAETLSVIIQVAYFRATGGRRLFKMTPIHYTFRLEGWSENRIAVTFWVTGAAAMAAAFLLARIAA